MNDRNLGYAVIFFLLLFTLVPATILSIKYLTPGHQRTVIFENVNSASFLRLQDQVRVCGIEAGKVRSVVSRDNKTYVQIETRQPLLLHEGYRAVAEAKGFMGDRYLDFYPGDPNAPRIDGNEPLKGSFPIGPTEAIAYAGRLDDMVHSLIDLTNEFRYGSIEKQSLIARFRNVTMRLDSMTAALTPFLLNTDRYIENHGDTLAAFLEKMRQYSMDLSASVPDAVKSTASIIAKTEDLLVMADTLVVASHHLMNRIGGDETLALNEDLLKLKQQIETLKEYITELQTHGLRLPVKLR